MTQEEKQILLKDLCSRLPYRVKVHIIDETGAEIDDELTTSTISHLDRWVVKPYLRPMSSMTDEEKDEWNSYITVPDGKSLRRMPYCIKYMDWLPSHHFDYRGLILKGLALEAPEDMYKEE